MSSIQIINNIEYSSSAHWVMIEIALKRCKHRRESGATHLSKHRFDSGVIFESSELLRQWIDLYNFWNVGMRLFCSIILIRYAKIIWDCWLKCKMRSNCTGFEELSGNTFANTSVGDLTATKSSKRQNYCDNESISIIFAALKCADSVLQLWLNTWKSYVIVAWCARCEVIADYWSVLRWSWRMPRLETWILNWWELSALTNTDAELVRIFPGRSLALSDFNGYFIIGRFYFFKKIHEFFVSKHSNFNHMKNFIRRDYY